MFIKLVSTIAVSSLLFSASVFAEKINENLEYSVYIDGNTGKLLLKNIHPESSIKLTSVTIAYSSIEKSKLVKPSSYQKEIKFEQLPIAPKVEVSLGEIAEISQRVLSGKETPKYNHILLSESSNCMNCESVGFAVNITVKYANGVVQSNLVPVFLNYLEK